MPSYLEREQTERIQPQIDNAQAIVNLYSTKLNLYGLQAGQVKSVRDSYMGLDLTRSDNQKELNGLMQQADTNLRASTRTDLSVGDNGKSALGAFDPITKNTDIMGDHAYTSYTRAQIAAGDAARIRDPKSFNQASYDGIKYQQQLFSMNPDKQSWQMFYQNKDNYTPYYDTQGELKSLQEMFKTDVIDKEDASSAPGYILGIKDQSWVKGKWQQFVEANASQKFKDQLNTEAKTEYRKSLVLSNGIKTDPATGMPTDQKQFVYGQYKKQFDNMRSTRIGELNGDLNSTTLALNTLSKNSADYKERYAQYTGRIKQINSMIASLNDNTNPDNHLPSDIGDPSRLANGEEIASQLYKHSYFDKIGDAFAHRDVKQSIKSDAAYWANQNLQQRIRESNEDVREFGITNNFNEKKLNQDWEIAKLNSETDLLKAGMKRDATGKIVTAGLDGETYVENAVASTGQTDPTKVGKDLIQGIEDLQGKGYTTIYNSVLSDHFGSSEYIKTLSDGGNKPLNQIVTEGGVSKEVGDKVKQFIADAYWGSTLYENMGIKSNDPIAAKKSLMTALDTLPASKITSLLYDSLSNDRIVNQLTEGMIDKPGGIKLKTQLEIAKQGLTGTVEAFNNRYGPEVAGYLKNVGYPGYVSPDSDLYKKGVRGYEQELNSFRVPSKAEITTFLGGSLKTLHPDDYQYFKNMYDKARKGDNSAIDKYAFDANNAKDIKIRVDHSQSVDEFVAKMSNKTLGDPDKIIDGMSAVIGRKGATGVNFTASTVTIDTKNRAAANTFLLSAVNRMDDNNTESGKKLAEIIKANPDVVNSYTIHSGIVAGKPNVTVSLDMSKIPEKDRSDVPSDFQNIHIGTSSELIPQRFRTNDPSYVALISQPKNYNITYGASDKLPAGSVKVQNKGSINDPNFELAADFYLPKIDKATGDIMLNLDGTLQTEHINDTNINILLRQRGIQDPVKEIQINPNGIYSFVVNKAAAYKELISYISKNKLTSLKDVPDNIMSQLRELTQ